MIRVNGEEFPWEEGLTVRRILDRKRYTFPAVIVAVNGIAVPEEEYDSTAVADGDEVKAFHLVAGG